jgi:hypothetical protein
MNNPHSKLIGQHAPGWLDHLQTQVEADKNRLPGTQAFALLDCAFSEPCYQAIRRHRLPFRSLFDLSDRPYEALQAVSPTLIPLSGESVYAWREGLALSDGLPMLSLIVTHESLDELALRLHPWCIVDADGQPFVFRFPDTRRLPAIVEMLSSEQHGAFFGPAHAWRFRTRFAHWADLPLPSLSCPPLERVRLDEKQCAHVIKDSEADEILADLNLNDPVLMRRYHPADAHELVTFGLKRADHYGIGDADRTQWCSLILQQPKLDQLPASAPLLASLTAKERSYADIGIALAALVQT